MSSEKKSIVSKNGDSTARPEESISKLAIIYAQRERLYRRYRTGEIDRREYIRLIEPLDMETQRLEMDCIRDIHLWERGFSKRAESS